jgi:4,4'-diaponeurosporenoate glycosyltransferase
MYVEVGATIVCLLVGFMLLARVPRLERARPRSSSPSLSIVIPARNERMSLPLLLSSIRASDVAPLEVLVVDDGSTDGTSEIAASLGATVIEAPPPPAGWNGKPWACWLGARRARGDQLLFLDADVALAPDALSRLCATHESGLLSVQPHHRTVRGYESVSGFFNLVSMMGSGAFTARSQRRPDRRDAVIAFGPCLLTSAAEYRAVDGHRAVRGSIVEDAALAARYAEHELPVRCYGGSDAISFRMYPDGLRPLLDGWTRTLAAGSSSARRLPVAAAVAWVASCAVVAGGAIERSLRDGATVSLAFYAAVALSIAVMQKRVGSFRWWSWALFPLPLACFIAVFARSVWCTHVRREVVWRARRVQLREHTVGDR